MPSRKAPSAARKWAIAATVLVATLMTLYIALSVHREMTFPGVDRTDHRQVAERFLSRNAVIARVTGRVVSLRQVGDGGSGGPVSYNVYRVEGVERTGVCQVDLRLEDNGEWRVTEAMLTCDGRDYRIPVRRAGVGRLFNGLGK